MRVKVVLRPAVLEDARFILDVRNDPSARKLFLDKKAIPWNVHFEWMKENLEKITIFIICDGREDLGYLRVSEDGEISIALLKEYRGMGIGTKALKLLNMKNVCAKITPGNDISWNCFTKAGFKPKYFCLERK